MEGDNENSDEKTLVPMVPADNDVFSPSFCSLLHPAFKSTAAASQESSQQSIPAEIDNDTGG
jgi:hypothetical protein